MPFARKRTSSRCGPENEPPTFKVTPTLANPGGRYSVDITHVATDNIPVDLPTTSYNFV